MSTTSPVPSSNAKNTKTFFHPSMPKEVIEQCMLHKTATANTSDNHLDDVVVVAHPNANTSIKPVNVLSTSCSTSASTPLQLLDYSFPQLLQSSVHSSSSAAAAITAKTDIPKHSIFLVKPLLVKTLNQFREDAATATTTNNNSTPSEKDVELYRRLAKITGIDIDNKENSNVNNNNTRMMIKSALLRAWRFAEVLPPPASSSTTPSSSSSLNPSTTYLNQEQASWCFMNETVAAMTLHNYMITNNTNTSNSSSSLVNFDCWLCHNVVRGGHRHHNDDGKNSEDDETYDGEEEGYVFVLRSRRDINKGEPLYSSCFYLTQQLQQALSIRKLLLNSLTLEDENEEEKDSNNNDKSSSTSSFVASYIQEFIMKPYHDYLEASTELAKDTLKNRASILANDHFKPTPKLITKKEKITKSKRLFFYTDSKMILENVKDPRYIALTPDHHDHDHDDVDNNNATSMSRADIIYLVHSQFKSSNDFPNAKFISQFPEEKLFVDKAALATTLAHSFGMPSSSSSGCSFPYYLPLSFVSTDHHAMNFFPAAFLERLLSSTKDQQQQNQNQNNKRNSSSLFLNSNHSTWISKSTNLARALGHCVWDSLPWLLRSAEEYYYWRQHYHNPCYNNNNTNNNNNNNNNTNNGASAAGQQQLQQQQPRILSEYIERPLLIRGGRKFDLRFMVMVCSLGLFHDDDDDDNDQKKEDEEVKEKEEGNVVDDNETTNTKKPKKPSSLDSEIYLYNEMFTRVAGEKFSSDGSTLHRVDQHFTYSIFADKQNNNNDDEKRILDDRRPLAKDLINELQIEYPDIFGQQKKNNKSENRNSNDDEDDDGERTANMSSTSSSPEGAVSSWETKVMPQIKKMIKNLFSKGIPLLGLPSSSSSPSTSFSKEREEYWNQRRRFRGMYGIDVMLVAADENNNDKSNNKDDDKSSNNSSSTNVRPILLEVTYAPDLSRVIKACPDFCDHAFNTMFRNEPTNCTRL